MPSSSSPILSESNREKQTEEIEVLKSVYDQEFEMKEDRALMVTTPPTNLSATTSAAAAKCTCRFTIRLSEFLLMEVQLPYDYPSHQYPHVTLQFNSASPTAAPSSSSSSAFSGAVPPLPSPGAYDSVLESMHADIPCQDEVVVFQYVEYLKEHVLEPELQRRKAWQEEQELLRLQAERDEHAALLAVEALDVRVSSFDDDHSAAGGGSSTSPTSASSSSRFTSTVPPPIIRTGEPLTDRKSTFQAHVASVFTIEDTRAMLSELYSHNKIARATHNMYAYVLKDANGIIRRENDDDGEDQAGSRLAHLLQLMQVFNVMVVVSRWYGGIPLGPDRFKHINNVARLGIEEHVNAAAAGGNGKEATSTSNITKKSTTKHANKR